MVVTSFNFGLVHAPLTPFSGEAIDFDSFGKVIEFHLANGAEGLALPMHTGESVSLTAEERKSLLSFALDKVGGRVPIVANASEAGTGMAASLAEHARQAGAAALIASVPYYWTPPESMLLEHFAAIAAAGQLPFFIYNAPEEMGGVKVSTNLVLSLIERSPHFAGLVDKSLDWQFMIDVTSEARRKKPAFQFISGTEYMISASAIGATGLLTSLATLAPRLMREFYDLCRREDYARAYDKQVDCAILFRLFERLGVSGLKAAAGLMGRDCGAARPPLPLLTEADSQSLAQELAGISSLGKEPRGWH
jgi:4-hydroxy-tetrahydrodipicolinate synthase